MKSIETVLRELTLTDLRDWAGGTILGRARPYAKCVLQLSRTPEEALVAWVIGTDRYVTSVRIPKPGHYDHACTCPYEFGGSCKHAVALVLAAQHPEVECSILASDQLASGRISALERSLRAEIRDLASEQARYSPWKGAGNRPVYSRRLNRGHAW